MLERLSFGSNAFTDGSWTLEDALRAIAQEGYRAVNILADVPLLWRPTQRRVKEIRAALKETGLVVSGLNGFTAAGYYGMRDAPPGQDFGPSFSDRHSKLRKLKVSYTREIINLAVALDTQEVSIGSGYPPEEVSRAEAWEWMKDSMEEVLDYAYLKGVYLNIEPEPQLLVATSSDVVRLTAELSHPALGVNLDIGHAFVCGDDVSAQIHRLARFIRGVDVEDIGLDERGKPVHYHLVPGEGAMPLEAIFQTFKRIGYKGYYTVELYSQPHRPVEVARESMAYFKHLEQRLARSI